jgi:uncharacterized membrane protein
LLTVATLTAAATVLSPAGAFAAPAACVWTPSFLPVPATITGGGNIIAADSQGGYVGEGYIPFFTGSRSVHVLRWQGGQVTDYGTMPGGTDRATPAAVNRDGVVVGHAQERTLPFNERAFRSRGTVLERLPEPPGVDASWATGINDNGDIVGHVGKTFQQGIMIYTLHTAVVWPANAPGTVVALTGGLPTTGQTKATGIDQDGTVLVEHYPSRTNEFEAGSLYLWRAGTARKLTLPSGSAIVEGNTISNGRVGGQTQASSTADGRGVLWDQSGTPLRPAASNAIHSVNRTGQSIGFADTPTLAYGVWQLDKQVTTLTSTLSVNVSADDGSIAGWSRASQPGAKNLPTIWRCI